jgi:hypothetical protein
VDGRRPARPAPGRHVRGERHRPAAAGLLRAQAATLLEAFADVRLVARPGPAGGNQVLLASDRPLPPGAGSSARGARTLDRAAVARFAAGADVLRDDDAPADQLLSPRR